MVLQEICTPALIYLVFSSTQVIIDTVKGSYNVALVKLWVTLIFTILLNFLCNRGLGIVSWIIVFIPFILMTVIVTLILVMFGLDPITGRKPRITKPIHNKHNSRKAPKSTETKNNHSKKNHTLEHADKFNINHDETKISTDQKKVLTDNVEKRAHLNKDPLQSKRK